MSLSQFLDAQIQRIKRLTAPHRAVPRIKHEPGLIEPGAYWHGTYYGYANRRCRCVKCRRAKSARERTLYLVRRDRRREVPTHAS